MLSKGLKKSYLFCYILFLKSFLRIPFYILIYFLCTAGEYVFVLDNLNSPVNNLSFNIRWCYLKLPNLSVLVLDHEFSTFLPSSVARW